MKRLIALILMTTILIGCSSSRTFMMPQAREGGNIERIFHEGYPVAVSRASETTVAAKLDKGKQYLLLDVYYNNLSERNIDVVPTDISITTVSSKGRTKNLKVYSAHKVLAGIRTKQIIGAVLMGISAAASSYNAGRSTTHSSGSIYGNTSGSIYGSGGSYASYSGRRSASYSGTATTYDPAKKAMVDQANYQRMAEYGRASQAAYGATEKGLLKRTTLFPNHYAEGKICIQKRKAKKYIISIPFGHDTHTIEFVPTKKR